STATSSPGCFQGFSGSGRFTRTGEERVYPQSSLVVRGRNEIYAVVEVEDSWRVGRFDGALELQAYSAEVVEPATFIVIADDTIYVQNRTGRVVDLAIDELEE
ncbi:MAG: hypothetical protein R6W94_05865, partial [Spirochaetia bacterium]